MKKRKWLFRILILGFIVVAPLAWYNGFVPLASGKTKAGIRHALDLKFLPSSLKINASGSESWTDYIFEADVSINPEQFDSLMSGREFTQEDSSFMGSSMTSAYRIENYTGFDVDATWEWSHKPPEIQKHDHGSHCTLYANKTRDRVFIRFTAD